MATSFAEGYQGFMGRWSNRLAEPVLDFCGTQGDELVLDVGCGLGSLASAVLNRTTGTRVVGVDSGYEAVEAARTLIGDRPAVFHVGDTRLMPYRDATFDRCIALLMLNFLPDYRAAATEMVRITRIGGVLGAAAWDFAGGLPTHRMFYDTAAVLDPEAGFHKGFARPLQRRGELAALWSECGLSSVEETALTIWMEFRDFVDYWAGWTWAQSDYLRRLSESASTRLMEYVRAAYLSGGPDGPRAFTATAWAVRGVRV